MKRLWRCATVEFHRRWELDFCEFELDAFSGSLPSIAEFCSNLPLIVASPNYVLVWWLFARCISVELQKARLSQWDQKKKQPLKEALSVWYSRFHSSVWVSQKEVDRIQSSMLDQVSFATLELHICLPLESFPAQQGYFQETWRGQIPLFWEHVSDQSLYLQPLHLLKMFEWSHPCRIVLWLSRIILDVVVCYPWRAFAEHNLRRTSCSKHELLVFGCPLFFIVAPQKTEIILVFFFDSNLHEHSLYVCSHCNLVLAKP